MNRANDNTMENKGDMTRKVSPPRLNQIVA
jgi:hypothetical protein